MGYESKMYVVKVFSGVARYALINNIVHGVFSKNDEEYYFPDGQTKTPVPPKTNFVQTPCSCPIAMLDLSCAGNTNTGQLIAQNTVKFEKGDLVVFDESGNTYYGLDRYEDYRKSIPIDTTVQAIKADHAKEPYRRFACAIALLESIQAGFPNEDIRVVFFGH